MQLSPAFCVYNKSIFIINFPNCLNVNLIIKGKLDKKMTFVIVVTI